MPCLNRKIRVTRLLVTVRVFCLFHTASKCTQTYHFGAKKFSLEGPASPPYWNPIYTTDWICQTSSTKWSSKVCVSTCCGQGHNSPQIHNIQQAVQHTTIHTKSNKCVSKMLTRHTGTAKCVICAAFWSFFLWLNCKIRVTRLLVTVRAFCLIHTALKCTKTYYFGAKKIFGSTLHPYWRLRRLTPVNIWIVTPKNTFYWYQT